MVSEKLNQAVQLIKSGNKIAALPILKEIVQAEPNNENAWLWLYSCVEKVEQKKYCLQQAIRINPDNQKAHEALLKLESQTSIAAQQTHPSTDPFTRSSMENLDREKQQTQPRTKESLKRKGILPFIGIFFVTACLVLTLLAILLVRIPVVSQIFNLFPEWTYSASMKPVLAELQVWLSGPVNQLELDLSSPYGHERESGYTNYDALNYYDLMPDMMRVLGFSPSQIVEMQQETRANLAENLLPTLSSVKQNGFVIVTKLEGINPPDSIKVAHERVSSCVRYKVETANAMIAFLDTGNDSNFPTGDCNFFEESLQMISDFIK